MAGRELPSTLVGPLCHARNLERQAQGLHRERFAVAATGALLLAAVEAGWQQKELAGLLGMKPQTVQKRVDAARARYGGHSPALAVDAPLDRPPGPFAVLRLPVSERAWLIQVEAAAHVGRHVNTIMAWRRRGILPNTMAVPKPHEHLYLRADLDRVVNGPRRGPYPDYATLLAHIEASPI